MSDNVSDNTSDGKAESQPAQQPSQSAADTVGKLFDGNDIGFLNDVQITLVIEVGRTQMKIRELLNLTKDSIIDLNKNAGDPVDIYANGKLISKGIITNINGKYCVKLSSIAQKIPQPA